MANLKPHKFTKEEMSKGGKKAGRTKMRNKILADKMLPYFLGEFPYNADGGKNNFVDDLDSLEPKERLQFTASVLQFLLPKLSQVDGKSLIDISGNIEISRDERQERIKELFEKTG